jgi:sulfur carrier protein
MNATVNGKKRALADGATVAELLSDLKLERNGIAVALNERVVAAADFDKRRLREGDVIEFRP